MLVVTFFCLPIWMIVLLIVLQTDDQPDMVHPVWGKLDRAARLNFLAFIGPVMCSVDFFAWAFILVFGIAGVILSLFGRTQVKNRVGDWLIHGTVSSIVIIALILRSWTK